MTTPSISAQARFDLDLHLIPTVGLGIGLGGTMLAAGGSAQAQLRADYDMSFHVEAQYDSSSDFLAPLSQSDYISDLGRSCLNWHWSDAKFGIEGHGVTLFFEYEWTYWYSTVWDTYSYSYEDSYNYDVDYTGFDRFGVAAFCGVCGAAGASDRSADYYGNDDYYYDDDDDGGSGSTANMGPVIGGVVSTVAVLLIIALLVMQQRRNKRVRVQAAGAVVVATPPAIATPATSVVTIGTAEATAAAPLPGTLPPEAPPAVAQAP